MRRFGWAVLAVASLGSAGAARADGASPYFGYSGYFGRPATYYTPERDVQVSSTRSVGLPNFGTRVYTPGGPFWYRQDLRTGTLAAERRARRRAVLRRRG